jgi:hydrogenase maturation factor
VSTRPTAQVCESDHCITCGDVGEPMTLISLDRDRELALCSARDGARSTVETALVAPVAPGDRLLVHAGTAIARLDGEAGEHPVDRETVR